MLNFFHTFLPQPIFLDLGFIVIRWYGLFMALAVLCGLLTSVRVAHWHGVERDRIYDLFIYVVLAGFAGARLFAVLYSPQYFWQHPLEILQIWHGGIAIHGALLGGALGLWWFSLAPRPLSLRERGKGGEGWLLAAIITPGIALGQAIGRFGNYFNQEVFGLPTNLPWGIPIDLINRPLGFENFVYFHPTFLYESIGNLIIFILLLTWHWRVTHNPPVGPLRQSFNEASEAGVERITRNAFDALDNTKRYMLCVTSYLLLYSALRFALEFLRIDEVLVIGGVRVTQGLSLTLIIISIIFIYHGIFRYNHAPS